MRRQLMPVIFGRRALSLRNYGPGRPLYIAHRAAGLMYPECTIEAHRAAYDAGLRVLEQDVHILTDGGLAVMHDTTVDRTTTSTGNVADLDTAGFKALAIDANTWHGTNFGNALVPPLMTEILAEFARRMIFVTEIKSGGNTAQALVNAFVAAGVPKDQAHFNSFTLSRLAIPKAAGYQVSFNANTGDATEISNAQAAGVSWVGLDAQTHNDTIIANWIAAGFTVILAGVNRRWQRDYYRARGVWAFYTDDPAYLASDTPFATADNFASGRWMNGMLTDNSGFDDSYVFTAASRGAFGSSVWSWTDTNVMGVLQGWACPIKGNPAANDFTIPFNLVFDSVTNDSRWFGIFVADAAKADQQYDPNTGSNNNGYHILYRRNGTLEIFRVTNGTSTSIASQTDSNLTLGQTYPFKLIMTPTAITAQMLNGDGSVHHFVTSSDTTYRGGYFHTTHSGATGGFRSITTPP